MKDLISVIMPCYNMERFVERSIASLQAQTYPHWELLVVDDGSVDSSRDILSRLAVEDDRIKPIFLEQNGGIANARNAGLAASTGSFVTFLDSDDLWEPHKLKTQLAFMKERNAAISYSAYYRVREDNTVIDTKHIPLQLTYSDLLKKNEMGCLSVMIDRSKTGEFTMPKIKHEDYATWLSILRTTGCTAYGINEPLARYTVRDGSVSRNKWKSMTWVYNIYTGQEHMSTLKAILYLARWFVKGFLSRF